MQQSPICSARRQWAHSVHGWKRTFSDSDKNTTGIQCRCGASAILAPSTNVITWAYLLTYECDTISYKFDKNALHEFPIISVLILHRNLVIVYRTRSALVRDSTPIVVAHTCNHRTGNSIVNTICEKLDSSRPVTGNKLPRKTVFYNEVEFWISRNKFTHRVRTNLT